MIIYTWKVLSPHPARDSDTNICEYDLHARQQMESKMNFHHIATNTTALAFMCIKQEYGKYMDVENVTLNLLFWWHQPLFLPLFSPCHCQMILV